MLDMHVRVQAKIIFPFSLVYMVYMYIKKIYIWDVMCGRPVFLGVSGCVLALV